MPVDTARSVAPGGAAMEPASDLVLSVLQAMAAAARGTRRQEAEIGSALRRAGLTLAPKDVARALAELQETGCLERIIPLSDGGTLVSVTATGLARAHEFG